MVIRREYYSLYINLIYTPSLYIVIIISFAANKIFVSVWSEWNDKTERTQNKIIKYLSVDVAYDPLLIQKLWESGELLWHKEKKDKKKNSRV